MVIRRLGIILTIALGGAAFGDDGAGRAKLIGTWQVQSDSTGAAAAVWSLQENGDAVRITHSQGGQKLAEFECNTMGRECAVKESGRQVKISMWYNGPKLVELESHGSDVVKRRFSVVGDEDAMEIELIPIAPAGKAETLHLKRTSIAAAHQ